MQIKFLGSGDAFCNGNRYQTCFLLTIPQYKLLIDCGATTLHALKTHGISTKSIDALVITHFHGDHFGGIPFLLLDAHYFAKRTAPLTIMGPPGIEERVISLCGINYSGIDFKNFSFPLIFVEFKDTKIPLGPLEITSQPVIHVAEVLPHGIRIQYQQKVLAFSGDTGWTDRLLSLARDADLFICECNFFRTLLPSHLNYQTILSKVPDFKCKRIVLNHLGPEMLENLTLCHLECAYDGMIIDI